ncbi:MAG TPA: MFS transporter [Acetobacteraceae bacterium]|nr:MFS transporter [Acetobacteraceae bacterium]
MQAPHPSARSQRGLDWLNFFIADVETAFGPFVAVYLTTEGWKQGAIGTAITVNTAIALATQLPAGWLTDRLHSKRLIVAVCLACIAGGALLIALWPTPLFVFAGEALHGITGGAVRIAIAAIGLGLVGHRALHTRVGRNHRYDSFGNAVTAGGMGALGQLVAPRAPFFAAAALCLPAAFFLTRIRGREINYARARQGARDREDAQARWRDLLRNHPLLIFAACLFLFQFTNASMLPLAGERLAAQHGSESELVTSALVIVPQTVTALIATWMARKADERGRKHLLLAAFAALLARAVLFAFAFGPWFLVAVQVLGGLTAAVIGILTPLVVADCTCGTGRYNFSLGAVGMIAGVGAAISTTLIGFVAQEFGFTCGFAVLAATALIGVAILWLFLPETVEQARTAEELPQPA